MTRRNSLVAAQTIATLISITASSTLANSAKLYRDAADRQIGGWITHRPPSETIIGLKTPPDADTFKRLEEHGMTANANYPLMFSLGKTSTLDQKKKVMEQFAENIIRHCQ